jgi:hypothetical protein
MPDEKPLSFEEVLAAEYAALRPGSGFDPGAPGSATDLFRKVHAEERPLSALCISGGGIRSATFALGALQGLAERGLLERFDYLSTVSGGGFAGGWLTAWIQRVGGIRNVIPHLRRDAPEPAPGEPDPIRHLREYNSYLSPRRGSFSADVWTLAATVLRNILLNWMVLIPLLLLALLVPRIYLSLLSFPEVAYGHVIFGRGAGGPGAHPNYSAPVLDAISGSFWVRYVLLVLPSLLFAIAWFNILRYLPGVGNQDHSRADYLRNVLAPLIGAVLTYLAFDSLYYLGTRFENESSLAQEIAAFMLPAAAAWILYLLVRGGSLRRRLRLLFGPLSLAFASMAAGIGVASWGVTNFLIWSPDPESQTTWAFYVTVGPPLVLLGYCIGTALFLGLSSSFLKDEDREWMSRTLAGALLFCFAWTVLCGLVLMLPHWVLHWRGWEHGLLALLGGASGWLSSRGGNGEAGAKARGRGRALSLAVKLAPPVFLAVLVVGLSIFTDLLLAGLHKLAGYPLRTPLGQPVEWHQHYRLLVRSQPGLVLALAGALLASGWLLARFVNINTFSLHGMYRDRLIRAYLGASNAERKASRFTGFANNDNLRMASLDSRFNPFHVVNLTLNLVASSRLDWQQRKAQPFTVTPFACGNSDLGYRPSAEYGGKRGISLGTAVAISGAAASPSMGSFSSPAVGFIMTLFNARLGAWLGNPSAAGDKTWRHDGPQAAIGSLLREALGLTSNESAYVYLSDGGHFENFGLYEMVRRRVRTIVVLDGGADPHFTFDDLGNALRKIRIDLRVPIDFDEELSQGLRKHEKRCAVAALRYSAVDGPCPDGRLIYVKPMLLGNEPPDVESYGKAHPDFPHESTANQWFDEAQTESYRQLGLFTLDEICRGWNGGSPEDFAAHLEGDYLAEGNSPREATRAQRV